MNYAFVIVLAVLVSALVVTWPRAGQAVRMDRCPYCHGDLDIGMQVYFVRCRECLSIVAITPNASPPSTPTPPHDANPK